MPMRFVVDPAHVALDAGAWTYLALLCVALPAAAVWQHLRRADAFALPPRAAIYLNGVITHAVFLVLAALLAWHLGIPLLAPHTPGIVDVVVGVVALALGLVPMLPRIRMRNPVGEARARLIAPHTARDHRLFYLLCISAGVAEELAYRGMLFTLLAALTGGWWAAALAGAAAFGVVHLFQGWRSAGIASLMGLREQIVVGLTGTLMVAIVVHMLHDAIAGTVIARRARSETTGQ